MGSSEEEESGMESGVDTYSRSSSRRETREDFLRALQGGDVANVRGGEMVVQDEHIKDGEKSKEEEVGSKRKRRESSSDPKRRRVCENPRQLGSKADSENNMTADGRACQVENSDQTAENFSAKVLTPLKTSHLLALNAQVSISPKPNKVPKTPSKSKEPIPNCIQKKMKKFKGSYTTFSTIYVLGRNIGVQGHNIHCNRKTTLWLWSLTVFCLYYSEHIWCILNIAGDLLYFLLRMMVNKCTQFLSI